MQKLRNKYVLNGQQNLLNTKSVYPLLKLMKDSGVEKLYFNRLRWFLDSDGNFSNPKAKYIKSGNVKKITKKGDIFTLTNISINPYYYKSESLA